jgi:hypothetical protein
MPKFEISPASLHDLEMMRESLTTMAGWDWKDWHNLTGSPRIRFFRRFDIHP